MSVSPFTRFARLGRRTIVLLGLGLFTFGAFAGWFATHVVVQGIGDHASEPPRLRTTEPGVAPRFASTSASSVEGG